MKVMRYSAILFSLMVLFSCDRGVSREDRLDPNNPVSLTIWHYYNGPQKRAFDQMVTLFNETEGFRRGISVEAFSQGGINQLFERVEAAALKEVGAARMPDIFAAYADFAYALDMLGVTADLAPYISSRELSRYVDSYVEEGYIDSAGGLTIFPTAKSTEVLMVNKTDWDIFAEATGVLVELLDTWEG
ncbi:MAG: extracellular solute-binding protein, partial [Spirochaetaceae bacterium]|nr:extracellular solute-binding protein [Spirochaetaceae bacterium]